jgi:hypothetical protein
MDGDDTKCCASQSTVVGRSCPHLKEHKETISQNYKTVVNYIKAYKSNTLDFSKVRIYNRIQLKTQLQPKNSRISAGLYS